MRIMKFKKNNYGNYTCQASNELGTVNHIIDVKQYYVH